MSRAFTVQLLSREEAHAGLRDQLLLVHADHDRIDALESRLRKED